jgi:solute carrier family 25 S-adenosylmethionine transporter 26
MTAASCGEVAACLIRVPTEVIKAKMQTSPVKLRLTDTVRTVLQEQHGSLISSVTGGLYRGFGMTLFREIPFAVIQFPMYERFKSIWSEQQGSWVNPVQAAACGSVSGAIAGGITTPLDVIKTRTQVSTVRI